MVTQVTVQQMCNDSTSFAHFNDVKFRALWKINIYSKQSAKLVYSYNLELNWNSTVH